MVVVFGINRCQVKAAFAVRLRAARRTSVWRAQFLGRVAPSRPAGSRVSAFPSTSMLRGLEMLWKGFWGLGTAGRPKVLGRSRRPRQL